MVEAFQGELRPPIGRFRVVGLIGTGGMGVVYRGQDPHLDRPVAIKVLKTGVLENPDHLERFRRECRAAGRLSHPGIVHVYDTGMVDGSPFLVMELVEGESLAVRLMREAVPPEQAVEIVRQLCDATGYLHGQGIVHRDIKPSNILLDGNGRVKLLDFGLAIVLQEARDITTTGEAIGTPRYMAPEQLEGNRAKIDARTDLYAVGAVLYEMLAGRPPIDGPNIFAVLQAIRATRPPAPSTINAAAPRRLDAPVLRCLSKTREERFASAEALKAALDAPAESAPLPAPPKTPAAPTDLGALLPEGPVRIRRRGKRRRLLELRLAAAAAALAAVPLAGMLMPGPEVEPSGTTAARGITRDEFDATMALPGRPARRRKLRELLQRDEKVPGEEMADARARMLRALGEFGAAAAAASGAREKALSAVAAEGLLLAGLGGRVAARAIEGLAPPPGASPAEAAFLERIRALARFASGDRTALDGLAPMPPHPPSSEYEVIEKLLEGARGEGRVEALLEQAALPRPEHELLEAGLRALRGERAEALRALGSRDLTGWRLDAARATLLLQEAAPDRAKIEALAAALERAGRADLAEAARR